MGTYSSFPCFKEHYIKRNTWKNGDQRQREPKRERPRSNRKATTDTDRGVGAVFSGEVKKMETGSGGSEVGKLPDREGGLYHILVV